MFALKPGDVIAGKYRIDRVLGQGGMGVVVAATHWQLAKRVAIKFLMPETLAAEGAAERFSREARAAVQFKGEHVARVMDMGTLETGAPYIVMEYLEGLDLAALLHTQGRLPITQAVDYVLQACEALAEAHGSLGIVHRDLKPANLFLTRRADGSALVKVLDFGISKVQSTFADGSLSLTSDTAIIGSPLYMSPEQVVSSRDVDQGTDIWSLGVILYELLAGAPPFHGESAPAVMVAIAVGIPAPLGSVRPDAPPELDAVIRRCLMKDRRQRYPSVLELARALEPYASAEGRASIESIARTSGYDANASPLPHAVFGAAGELDPELAALEASETIATIDGWGQSAITSSRRKVGLVSGLAVAGALVLGLTVYFGVGSVDEPALSPAPPAAAAQVPAAPAASVRAQRREPAPMTADEPVRWDPAPLPTVALTSLPELEAPPAHRVVRPTPAVVRRPAPPPRRVSARRAPVTAAEPPAAKPGGWQKVFDDVD